MTFSLVSSVVTLYFTFPHLTAQSQGPERSREASRALYLPQQRHQLPGLSPAGTTALRQVSPSLLRVVLMGNALFSLLFPSVTLKSSSQVEANTN